MDDSDKNKLLTGEENVDFEGEPGGPGPEAANWKVPTPDAVGGGEDAKPKDYWAEVSPEDYPQGHPYVLEKAKNTDDALGGAGGTEDEQIVISPEATAASDAAAGRIIDRTKAGFVDIAGINAAAIGFTLGANADSRLAMIASVVVGAVATGKFVKDAVSMAMHNRKDQSIASEGNPDFVTQRNKLLDQQDELKNAARVLEKPKV